MPTVFIGVGSNLGDRERYFQFAKAALSTDPDVRDLKCSPVYETEPFEAAGGKFLNAVWSFETELEPKATLALLQAIEEKAGRVRMVRNEPRCLDLDLLFYGQEVVREKDLVLPHPRIEERAFVLLPLCDLAPELKHPVLKKTIKELLTELSKNKHPDR